MMYNRQVRAGMMILPVLVIAASLGSPSLWGDEVFSVNFAASSFDSLISQLAQDYHPPLYFLILKFWISAFGCSVFALRMMQLVIGFGYVYFFIQTVEKVSDDRTEPRDAWLVAVFLITPAIVLYLPMVRYYSFAAMLVMYSTSSLFLFM